MNEKLSDHANVVAPPPLIFLGTFLVGWLLHVVLPLPLTGRTLSTILGLAFCFLGFLLAFWAIRALMRLGTTIRIEKPTTAIVQDGPYRLSRNPLYLSLSMLYLGFALLLNSLAIVALLPLALAIIHFGVVLREEKYLSRKFEAEYRDYTSRVRWP